MTDYADAVRTGDKLLHAFSLPSPDAWYSVPEPEDQSPHARILLRRAGGPERKAGSCALTVGHLIMRPGRERRKSAIPAALTLVSATASSLSRESRFSLARPTSDTSVPERWSSSRVGQAATYAMPTSPTLVELSESGGIQKSRGRRACRESILADCRSKSQLFWHCPILESDSCPPCFSAGRIAGMSERPKGRGPLTLFCESRRFRWCIIATFAVVLLAVSAVVLPREFRGLKTLLSRVSPGMTREQVENIFGRPALFLRDGQPGRGGTLVWVDQLWQADVILDSDGKVMRCACTRSYSALNRALGRAPSPSL